MALAYLTLPFLSTAFLINFGLMKKFQIFSSELSFRSKLERIAAGKEYYAVSVPKKITLTLNTKGPVPIVAWINNSEEFKASLFPVGGGRHYLRVKNKLCKAAKIKEHDPVQVRLKVRDRSTEASIPKDLMHALRAVGLINDFKSLPIGKKSYLLRLISEAVKAQTRSKRVQAAVKAALKKQAVSR